MIAVILTAALVAASATGSSTDVGRPVASIVSPIWSDPAHRDAAHEVDQIAGRLHLTAGMHIADIGAGSGYDTVKLSKLVGPSGRVYAEDVTPAYVQDLRRTIAAEKLNNVEVVLGSAGDPLLPPRSIDAAIMVHMYHEIQEPMALLAKLAPAFKTGGRLGVEELDRPTQDHGTPPKLLACELAAAGYHLVEMSGLSGNIGYFAVFRAPAEPRPNAVVDAKACAR